jgi:hypothetical protein
MIDPCRPARQSVVPLGTSGSFASPDGTVGLAQPPLDSMDLQTLQEPQDIPTRGWIVATQTSISGMREAERSDQRIQHRLLNPKLSRPISEKLMEFA